MTPVRRSSSSVAEMWALVTSVITVFSSTLVYVVTFSDIYHGSATALGLILNLSGSFSIEHNRYTSGSFPVLTGMPVNKEHSKCEVVLSFSGEKTCVLEVIAIIKVTIISSTLG